MPMKSHATFAAYLSSQSTPNRSILRALRKLVRRTAPGLEEAVKWGNGCWVKGTEPVAFVYCRAEYVEFGFFRATALDDPAGLLEGKGRFVRHVKMRRPADAERSEVARLLRQAVRLAGADGAAGPKRSRRPR